MLVFPSVLLFLRLEGWEILSDSLFAVKCMFSTDMVVMGKEFQVELIYFWVVMILALESSLL